MFFKLFWSSNDFIHDNDFAKQRTIRKAVLIHAHHRMLFIILIQNTAFFISITNFFDLP